MVTDLVADGFTALLTTAQSLRRNPCGLGNNE
jgi:hypothetical protein